MSPSQETGPGTATLAAKRPAGKVERVHSLITPFHRRLLGRHVWLRWSGTARIIVEVVFRYRMEGRRSSQWYVLLILVLKSLSLEESFPHVSSISLKFCSSRQLTSSQITNKTGGDSVHLDMSPDTFSQLADKSLGEIDIEWAHVACPITTPIQIRMHTGASQYWFAATVENAVFRTASLEVSADSGSTWKATTRNTNNYFELSGGTGTTSAWVKVTSELGESIVVENVELTAGVTTKGTSNYSE
ncbi:MAG: hypothetical protein Q9227_006542 [Pyrenula ochraceoflavens]